MARRAKKKHKNTPKAAARRWLEVLIFHIILGNRGQNQFRHILGPEQAVNNRGSIPADT